MKEKGFTLIELIVVIVILGILAATALPKFIDVKSDAQAAAIQGVAGAVSSGFATNYAGYQINTAKGVAIAGGAVDVDTAAKAVLAGNSLPAGYTATAAAATVSCTAAGQAIPITISNSSHDTAAAKSAAATLVCTGA